MRGGMADGIGIMRSDAPPELGRFGGVVAAPLHEIHAHIVGFLLEFLAVGHGGRIGESVGVHSGEACQKAVDNGSEHSVARRFLNVLHDVVPHFMADNLRQFAVCLHELKHSLFHNHDFAVGKGVDLFGIAHEHGIVAPPSRSGFHQPGLTVALDP